MPNDAPPDGGSMWPIVAVHSADMTTRGERIKRARNLLRQSQMDVHKATGVGLRTIGRIEAGENEHSPSVEVLENHFGINDSSVGTDNDAPDTAEPVAGAPPTSLDQFTLMELLVEVVRRVAQFEARTGEHLTGLEPPRRVKWSTSDAPSVKRAQEASERPRRNIRGTQ
jgi:transcriptional regulator with XRE-family HTH domain